MKKISTASIIIILFIQAAAVSALTGRDVMQQAEDKNSSSSVHSLVDLKLIDRAGSTSTRILEMFTMKNKDGETRSLIIFHSPASVKNTRFLSLENRNRADDQWIYLPALKKVRRIAAGEGNKSFMGTDFTYDDMGTRNIDEDNHTLTGEEELNGRICYVVVSEPKNKGTSQYSKRISWIDKEMLIPLKLELFDKNGKLAKIMTMENIKRIQGRWTPLKTTMENIKTRHKTVISITKIVYDEKLPEGIFTTRFIKTGRL